MFERREQDDAGTSQGPVGLKCQDCPYQDVWHPVRTDREQCKHDMVTDHDVEYVDPEEVRVIRRKDGSVVQRLDEQDQLVTDGGTDHPVGMPPHKYEQAKERARDDLDRRELTNLVHGLPCVCEVLVDGEDEEWRPTTVTVGFSEDYGGGIDDTITVMQRAGWRIDGITFGAYRRVRFEQRGEQADE